MQFLLKIGNIRHNFLVPRMNEPAPKTFMPIPTSDLYRVYTLHSYGKVITLGVLTFWS